MTTLHCLLPLTQLRLRPMEIVLIQAFAYLVPAAWGAVLSPMSIIKFLFIIQDPAQRSPSLRPLPSPLVWTLCRP